jgi:Holliday junction DNA helicase RuvA
MIAFLKGVIEEIHPDRVLVDVNGVGYEASISLQTYEALNRHNGEVKIRCYQHITDSDMRLFGFYTQSEMELFEKLITVKGVGPKLGLTILSGLSADEISHSIVNADAARLSKIPGIGKKSAERIILELKDKMEFTGSDLQSAGITEGLGARDEAVSALESLGYKKKDAEQVVSRVMSEGITEVSAIIKKALSELNR